MEQPSWVWEVRVSSQCDGTSSSLLHPLCPPLHPGPLRHTWAVRREPPRSQGKMAESPHPDKGTDAVPEEKKFQIKVEASSPTGLHYKTNIGLTWYFHYFRNYSNKKIFSDLEIFSWSIVYFIWNLLFKK